MKSDKDWLLTLLLSLFLGTLGADRFYVGKIGTGIRKRMLELWNDKSIFINIAF